MTRGASGFTLVELLVALALFALISVASLALLRSSIDTQTVLSGRIDRAGAIERTRSLIADALLTAQPQDNTGPGSAPAAFAGTREGLSIFTLVHGADEATARVRLSLRISAGQLLVQRDDGEAAVLLDDLSAAHFRYRGADGSWQSDWTPAGAGMMPRAAELSITRQGQAEVVMRFVVAPDWPAERPGEVPA